MSDVKCRECETIIDEASDLPFEKHSPCPKCGSKSRIVNEHIEDTVIFHGKLGLKARHGQTGKPFYESISGSDLNHKTGEWMKIERVIDRENDKYKEKIINPKTKEVLRHCEEPLSQHTGHGYAKYKKMTEIQKAIVKWEREVNTFANLYYGADVLIKKTEDDEKGSYFTTMGSILLTAFTIEAYLNHIGEKLFSFWEEIESIRFMDKLRVISKHLEIEPDFSKRPYQTIRLLFRFRDSIAHGRSKILKDQKSVKIKADKDIYDYIPKSEEEEYCTLDNAKRAKEDIEIIITEIHKKANLGDYPFIIPDMSIGSMSIESSTNQSS